MPSPSASAHTSRPPGISPGSVIGGRFEIQRAVSEDSLGALLAAKDQKTKRPIAVRLLSPGLLATEEALEQLRGHVRKAATIQHRNLVATYGMGTDKGSGSRYIANEWVKGDALSALTGPPPTPGASMTLDQIHDVTAQVCEALEAVRAAGTCHGAVRPGVVYLSSSGRIKLAGLGLDLAIVRTAGPAALGPAEQAFLAPEVKAGHAPDPRSDVFGVGGLLYAMFTGRGPLDEFIAPSRAHPEATDGIDAILMRCLAADPAARFDSPAQLASALADLRGGEHDDEHDLGLDIDVHVDSAPPPADPATPAVAVPKAAPQVGDRVSLDQPLRVADLSAAPAVSAEVDLSSLLSKITENDAPRWMVVKDNLDHGPFSGRELVSLVLKGDVLGRHGLLNMDTGERCKIADSPEFAEFAEQWELKKKAADHAVALERSAKVEKASMATKVLILGGIAAALGIAITVFLVTRPDVRETARADADLTDLQQAGQIEITGTAGLLPDPPASTRRRGRRVRRGGGGSSYEDAMNQVVDLGSAANRGGSQARLSPAQVAGTMNANINRLVPCLSQGSGGGQVRIDLAIGGNGRVLGASVRNGTPGFQRCVAGRVRQIRFPTFAAPRMGATYSFSAN